MARKRKNRFLEHIEITDIAPEGRGVGRIDGRVIFVERAVPGDVVTALLDKSKESYAKGKIHILEEASPLRQDAFCEHFGKCGGCKWQFLAYEKQLEFKHKIVEDALRRTGKIYDGHINPIIGSVKDRYYRNKLEFSFSNARYLTPEEIASGAVFEQENALGFHAPRLFSKIVDVKACHLMESFQDDIRNSIRVYAEEHDLTFYDIRKKEGLLRNLIVRNTVKGQWMVIMIFGQNDEENVKGLMDHLVGKFPQLDSLSYVINTKNNDTIFDLEVINYYGKDHITEYLEELQFKISPKSFFQPNPTQALTLYGVIRELANLQGNELVYDLYTGTGSIAQFLARYCKKVVGIEEVADSIKDACYNAEQNGLTNCTFLVGDVRKEFNDHFIAEHGKPDLLITDPPRSGLHADVVDKIVEIAAPRVIYVSCNPVTQARDLNKMLHLYEIVTIQPVDMFPQTHHVENVVLLKIKDDK